MSPVPDPSQEAVFACRDNLCVVAGAGSGKTGTLVEHVVGFIEEDLERRSLSRVLALTFSEKAAAEMRSRILSAVRERLGRSRGREEALGWERELRRLGQAEIGTIHGYAYRLVNSYSWLLGLPRGLSAEEGQADDSDLESLLIDLLSEENRELLALCGHVRLRSDMGPSLACWLKAASARISSWGLSGVQARPAGPLEAIREEAGAALSLMGERAGAFAAWLSSQGSAKDREKNLPYLEAMRELGAFLGRIGREGWPEGQEGQEGQDGLESLERRLAAWGPGLESLVARISGFRETSARPPFKSQLREALESYRAIWSDLAAWPVKRDLSALLGLIPERLLKLRLARSGIGFDDMLSLARRLLRERPGLRAQEAAKWQLVVVDEFQDTNRLQADLLALVLSDPEGPAHSWGTLPWASTSPRFRAFGDPKQSIYRFRGSEPSIMGGLTKALPRSGGKVLTLGSNYRTGRALVDFFNAYFPDYLSGDYPAQKSPRELLYPGPPLAVLTASPAKGTGKDDWAKIEADLMAAYLRDLVSGRAGVLIPCEGDPEGPGRPPRPGDVAILMRRKKRAAFYEGAIARAGFSVNTLKGREAFGPEEVRGLSAAYLFLCGHEPGPNLAAALLSPLGRAGRETLAYLAWPGPPGGKSRPLAGYFGPEAPPFPEMLERGERENLEELRELFLALSPYALRRPPGEILETLVEERKLIPYLMASAGGGPERVRNVQHFLGLSKSLPIYDQSRPESPALLLARLWARGSENKEEDLEDDGEEGGEPSRKAINIMTVHRAKGLEFPVVFIPEADQVPQARSQGLLMGDDGSVALRFSPMGAWSKLCPRDYALMEEREREESAKESRRLFYVAATRARDHLVLLGRPMDKAPNDSWLHNLLAFPDLPRHCRTIQPGEGPGLPSGEEPSPWPGAGGPIGQSGQDPGERAAGKRAEGPEKLSLPLIRPLPRPRALTLSITGYAALLSQEGVSVEGGRAGPDWPPAQPGYDSTGFGPTGYPERKTPARALDGYGLESLEPGEDILATEKREKADSWGEPGQGGGPEGPTPPRDRGILFHASMEKSHMAMDFEGYREFLEERASRLGLCPSQEEIAYLAGKAMAFQESRYGRELRQALSLGLLVWRERSLWMRLERDSLGYGPITLTGAVDLFYAAKDGGGRIVDYKLSRPKDESKYLIQIGLYAKAMKMAGFGGQIETKLWYLEE